MAISSDLGLDDIEPAPETETVSDGDNSTGVVEAETNTQDGDGSSDEPVVIEAPELDMDQYGDHLVPRKIDGEVEWVPLAEAVAGSQRQADYTRKTQELAAQVAENEAALQLANAFKQDPEFTVRTLAMQQGLQIADTNGAAPQDAEYQTPEEQALATANAKIADLEAKFQATEAQTAMDREMSALEAKVGSKLDRQALMGHMASTNVWNAEAAWAHMNMDAAVNGRAGAANEAAKAQVIEAKRQNVVHKPTTGAAQSQSLTPSEVPNSLRESALMAENNQEVPAHLQLPDWFK